MEGTVVSVGKAVLDGALSYAKSSISEEVALQLGIKRDHDFIKDELEMMQSFLMAAQEGQDEHKVLQSWVKQVRQVSYDVEDCLQEFSIHLDNPSWWRLPLTLLDRRRIAKQMKELRARVQDVSQRHLRYHLIRDSSCKPAVAAEQPSITFASMFGSGEARERRARRTKAKVDLVQLISKNNADLRVIAVWGTNYDIGRTSIIRRAYDNQKIQEIFECQAWIRLMHPFNQSEFLKSIVMQFYYREMGAQVLKKMGKLNQDDLIEEFNSHVNEKRYLVVFNNLLTIEDWDWIKIYFPDNKKGSRIVVSTEQVGVARLCMGQKYLVSKLEQLSADETHFAFYYEDEGSQDDEMPQDKPRSSAGSLEELALFVRCKEMCQIVSIVSSQPQFSVISVWGMGGLGKTTLVKQVYQSPYIVAMFQKFAWVNVMHPFNPMELLESLIMQLRAKMGVESQSQELVTLLEGNSYLIVIDDLSSTEQWDMIKMNFPMDYRSRIIVTTREKDIAMHCSQKRENVYKLQVLVQEDALRLFESKVFMEEYVDLFQRLEIVQQANLILRKCAGLPLSIATIGGFLANQPKTAMEWTNLNWHINAELEMHPEAGPERAVIATSYDGLPYHLKFCLLYSSIFPEHHNVRWGRLVRRWIAEGYIKETSNKSAKEIASNYLMELIGRSMVLPLNRRLQTCQVHSIIHEISVSKSMEANLVFTLGVDSRLVAQVTTHHLAVSDSWIGDEREFASKVDLSQIRSLTVFGQCRPFFISDKMRLLQVLDLENTSGVVGEHLEHVWKLLRLVYLSLRGCVGICYLPESLGNLRRLQTLDIRGTSVTKLPKTFVNLQMLQYLYAGQKTIDEGSNEEAVVPKLDVCCAPQLIPNTAWRGRFTPALRLHRHQYGVVFPRGIGKLRALQILKVVSINRRRNGAHLEEIKRLTWLRKLGVVGINKKNCQEFCSTLDALPHLESLSVRSMGEPGLDGCLDSVSSTPKNLRSLKLYGNLVRLPEWIIMLPTLVKLKLEHTKLLEGDAVVWVLGKLPNLAILLLLEGSFGGEEIRLTFPEMGFPSLMCLQLSCIHGLRSVEFDQGATPKLESLSFMAYPSDANAGMFSGLSCLPILTEFMLDNDKYEDDFLEDVQAQLAMNRNKPLLKRRNFR